MREYFVQISEVQFGLRYLIVTELSNDTSEYRSTIVDSDYSVHYVSNFYINPCDSICECAEWAFSKESTLVKSHLYVSPRKNN
jgi:hypothetical protein